MTDNPFDVARDIAPRNTILLGDCLDVMRGLPDACIDAVVTDPPYALTDAGVKQCPFEVMANVVLPDYGNWYASRSCGGHLPLPGDSITFLDWVSGAVGEEPRVGVPEGAVNFERPAREKKVEHADELPRTVSERELGDELDPSGVKCGSDFIFNLRPARDAAICNSRAGSVRQLGAGRIAVPIVILAASSFHAFLRGLDLSSAPLLCNLVRSLNDSLGHTEAAPTVVAGRRAEVRAVLALDMRRGTAELAAAGGASEDFAAFELCSPQAIATAAGTSCLPAELQPLSFGLVGAAADGTFTIHLHKALLKAFNYTRKGFMGKEWDGDIPSVDIWREVMRVLKPGGWLLSFGGARTYHRMVVNVEDAGFEIRDQIMWIQGSGFPKGTDVGWAIHNKACSWHGIMERYDPETEPQAEHHLRFVLGTYVSQTVYACPECGQVLQPWVPEPCPPEHRAAWAKSKVVWPEQPRMEGRGDVEAQEGELRRCQACTLSGRPLADGAEGWVHRRASVGDGPPPWALTEPDGSCASYRPQSLEQLHREPDALFVEWRAQTRRGTNVALKPAHEPIVVARKPCIGTVADNVILYGTGALNIDAARIATTDNLAHDGCGIQRLNGGLAKAGYRPSDYAKPSEPRTQPAGRWPANVVLDEEAAALLDEQSGVSKDGVIKPYTEQPQNPTSFNFAGREKPAFDYGGSGGASRFFMRCTSDCPICLGPKHDIMSAWQAVCSADAPSLDGLGNDSAGALAPQSQQQSSADRAESSNTDVPPAVITSMTSLATRAATVLPNAAMQTAQRTAQLVKSAGSLCDSCAIGIALSLAAMQHGLDPESLHGLDSIFAPRRQTLYRCLALLAASLPSTDTTPTTASLSMWFGCVRDAMQSSTLDAETVGESDRTRFRYQSKASRSERNKGCEGLPEKDDRKWSEREQGSGGTRDRYPDGSPRPITPPASNHHPTVKPVKLMRWLIRLVTQPGDLVLDPFLGSGTTAIAAEAEGRSWAGIEMSEEYCEIAKARILAARGK